jgi:hypothetical protein
MSYLILFFSIISLMFLLNVIICIIAGIQTGSYKDCFWRTVVDDLKWSLKQPAILISSFIASISLTVGVMILNERYNRSQSCTCEHCIEARK